MTAHVVVVTRDAVSLQHPEVCARHMECPEGVLERQDGLTRPDVGVSWEKRRPGLYVVHAVEEFRDGEWLAWYELTEQEPVEDASFFPDGTEPQKPLTGLRGFPWRWSS